MHNASLRVRAVQRGINNGRPSVPASVPRRSGASIPVGCGAMAGRPIGNDLRVCSELEAGLWETPVIVLPNNPSPL